MNGEQEKDEKEIQHSELREGGATGGEDVRKWLLILGAGLGVLVAGVIVWLVSTRSSPEANRNSQAAQPAVAIVEDRSSPRGLAEGAEGQLTIPGRDTIMIATDEQALNDLTAALASRSDGVNRLIESGKVVLVPDQTKVRIMGINSGRVKVRVLEGQRTMLEGWVHERWIR